MEDQVLMEYARLLNRESDAVHAKNDQEFKKVKNEIVKLREGSEILQLYYHGKRAELENLPVPDGYYEIEEKIKQFKLEDKYSVSKLSDDELFNLLYRRYCDWKNGSCNFEYGDLQDFYENKTGKGFVREAIYREQEEDVSKRYELDAKSNEELFNLAVVLKRNNNNETDGDKRKQSNLDIRVIIRLYSKRTGTDSNEVSSKVSAEAIPTPQPTANKIQTKQNSTIKTIKAHLDWISFNDINASVSTRIVDMPYAKILDYKLNDNSQTITAPSTYKTKTDLGSVVGRSIIGGLLTGGIGAFIGGATANKKTVQTSDATTTIIHNYELVITLDNTTMPNITLNFKEDKRSAEEAASMLGVIINRNKQKASSQIASPSSSIADELTKIADLKAKGLITDEEFNVMKKKIIGI